MYKRKNNYGQTTAKECFFCGKPATHYSEQEIQVCLEHKDKQLEIKCPVCNGIIEGRKGKYGSYFYCWKCGNIPEYKVKRFIEGI